MTDHEKTLRTIALTYGHDAELHELNEQTQTAAIERNRQAACIAGAEAIAKVNQTLQELCEYLLCAAIAKQKIRLTIDEIVELIDESKYVFSAGDSK